MGGPSVSTIEEGPAWTATPAPWDFTDAEKLASEVRAEELINEYDLLSGIGAPEECLSAEEIDEHRSERAALIGRLAQRALPSEAPDAPAQVFNRLHGYDLVVENVCALNCPLDTQRVIYYRDVTGSNECSQAEGAERAIEARSSNGRLQERTFCVPRLLLEDLAGDK